MTVTDRRTLVFDANAAVFWAEEVAQARSVPVEVVPAPAASEAKCDLALVCRPEDGPRLETGLRLEGVPFKRWR